MPDSCERSFPPYVCIRYKGVFFGGLHTLVPEKLARDVQILTSHNHDLLAVEQLFGHDTGQTTKEMSLAIDNDLRNSHQLAQLFPRNSSVSSSSGADKKLANSSGGNRTHHRLELGHSC